ncbi:hypothetical protein O8C74_08590 [Aliarcobacter butzleri]|uniref:hypothetical protein n=1 Tax=Aliarcobacter butzleri TaxID=28197 RepID=UPI00263E47E8|nr:hypothetical protein [Aliarcobacter butzleri]MDN5087127.1 hypothetical protein [Aliarcobacter butzleri]
MDALKLIGNKGLSSFEKIIEFRHFTLIWSFIFALDIFCIIVYKQNFISVFSTTNFKDFEMVYLILFIGLFTFLMTLFFPTLRYILRTIIFLIYNDTSTEKNTDYKYLFSVKKEALKTKDSFLASLVEKKEIENKNLEIDLNISFALSTLVIVDYFLSSDIQSISSYLISLSENISGIFYITYLFMIIVFIVILGFWLYTSLLPYQIEKIYLPDDEEPNKTLERNSLP